MTTNQRINLIHEVRMTITGIVVPLVGAIMAVPELRQWVGDKTTELRNKLESK